MTRANAAGRLFDVRRALGERANQILRMMLVDERSFRQIGEVFFPRLNATVARGKMSAQCSMLLQQLSGFYQMQKRRKEKTCTPHAVSI